MEIWNLDSWWSVIRSNLLSIALGSCTELLWFVSAQPCTWLVRVSTQLVSSSFCSLGSRTPQMWRAPWLSSSHRAQTSFSASPTAWWCEHVSKDNAEMHGVHILLLSSDSFSATGGQCSVPALPTPVKNSPMMSGQLPSCVTGTFSDLDHNWDLSVILV